MISNDYDAENAIDDDAAPDLADLFPGFEARRFETGEARIFARIGGEGPPLVCLHGFPQSHVMWHRLAPKLAERFTLVLPDLRGYGWSSAPRSEGGAAYAKRAMARDVTAMMSELGHARFACLAHDRGARVAYRLGLDRPGALTSLMLLDVLPTYVMWRRMRASEDFARKSAHWHDLSAPAPDPEDAILADPDAFLRKKLDCWSATGLKAFDAAAIEHYSRPVHVPERVHAMCEDYRAGATHDLAADEADLTNGRTLDCPLRLVWGKLGFPAGGARFDDSPLDAWAAFAPRRSGAGVPGGHFCAEEAPDETLAALEPGLAAALDAGSDA